MLSPNWWTWKPRLALGSLPLMLYWMVVGDDSEACSKVTVPLTLESPRRTATVLRGQVSNGIEAGGVRGKWGN